MNHQQGQRKQKERLTQRRSHRTGAEQVSVCQTHHFFDLSLGAGFLGMRNSALMGCMSHRAEEEEMTGEEEEMVGDEKERNQAGNEGRKETEESFSDTWICPQHRL